MQTGNPRSPGRIDINPGVCVCVCGYSVPLVESSLQPGFVNDRGDV